MSPPGPADGEIARLRVATFNCLHGLSLTSGTSVVTDLMESARVLDADIVGLQEVDRLQSRSDGIDQAAVVAAALDAPYWRYVPALDGTPRSATPWTRSSDDDGATTAGPTFGLALMSRWPVRQWLVRRFPRCPVVMPVMTVGSAAPALVPEQPRIALGALVDGPRGPLTVVTTHLSIIPGWNVAQLRSLARWACSLPPPRLLFGDLNLPAPLVRRTTGWEQLARAATFPAQRPRVQLDHILGDGIGRTAVQDARAVELPVSDHRALVVTLRL